jgi:predicted kinase
MSEIIVIVGNIGSGKSTYAKKLAKEGYIVVARDALRYMIGGGDYIFDKELEPIVWQGEWEILFNLMQRGINIVVDEVGVSSFMRERYLELADIFDYKISAHIMPEITKEEAVNRRMNNPHGQPDKELWIKVWDMFNSVYEEPTEEEGFDEIRYIKEV